MTIKECSATAVSVVTTGLVIETVVTVETEIQYSGRRHSSENGDSSNRGYVGSHSIVTAILTNVLFVVLYLTEDCLGLR